MAFHATIYNIWPRIRERACSGHDGMNPTSIQPLAVYPAGEHRLHIDGPAGPLEAVLSVPDAASPGRVAIICHPNPAMGGTMTNKVVFSLHRACRDQSLMTLRFNFRGVGASAGAFDHGAGEQDDLLAVLAWAWRELAARELVLAGFSFGSFVAASVWPRALAGGWRGRSLILAAPPVTRFPLDGHALPAGTRVIYGDADEVVDPLAIRDWLAAQPAALEVCVLAGAGHFFHGRLTELKAWVEEGLGVALA